MKAAVYERNGGPEVFQYVDVPDPTVRPGGEVIDIKAIGIQGARILPEVRGGRRDSRGGGGKMMNEPSNRSVQPGNILNIAALRAARPEP